jgi:hypothetical protein
MSSLFCFFVGHFAHLGTDPDKAYENQADQCGSGSWSGSTTLISQQLQKTIILELLFYLVDSLYPAWIPDGYHDDIFWFTFTVNSWWPLCNRFFNILIFQCCESGSGIRCFFDPFFDPGPGMNIPDLIFEENIVSVFWVKNTLILWWRSGSGIRDLVNPRSGVEKIGSWRNIPDPQHCHFLV